MHAENQHNRTIRISGLPSSSNIDEILVQINYVGDNDINKAVCLDNVIIPVIIPVIINSLNTTPILQHKFQNKINWDYNSRVHSW